MQSGRRKAPGGPPPRPVPRVAASLAAAVLCVLGVLAAPALARSPAPAPSARAGAPDATARTTAAPGGAARAPLRKAGERPAERAGPDRFVPGQVLVRYRSGVDPGERRAERRAQGARLERPLPVPLSEVVKIVDGESVAATVADFEHSPDVLYAQPNYIRRVTATPNDPRFGALWGLNAASDADIDAPEAWDRTTGSPAVTVAVVDTGVAGDHPDLAPNMWHNPGESGADDAGRPRASNGVDDDGNGKIDDARGWDFSGGNGGDNDPSDGFGHGTHVAGTIGAAGNNGQGVTGVNWRVGLMPVKVMGDDGYGDDADIAAGFSYAARMGADVVNASLGGAGSSPLLEDAVDAAPGTLFVVAAGNDGADNDAGAEFPCDIPAANLICVAATSKTDALAGFSNYGARSVDLAAPGQEILSTVPAAGPTVFSDDFEHGLVGWSTAGTGRTWGLTGEAAASGTHSLTDSPYASYSNYSDSSVQRHVDLSGKSGCRLDYAALVDTEPNLDLLHVEASADGVSWTPLGAHSGSVDGLSFSRSLAAFDGRPDVRLRFRLTSDGSVTADGAYVDDVKVACAAPAAFSADSFATYSGTSMATPHVAGVAALLLSARPGASVAALRRALLDSADRKPSLAGKTVTGGRLNARGALDALEDTTPPRASAPSASLTGGSTLGTTTAPVRIAWSGADDRTPAYRLHYDLEQRPAGTIAWTRVASNVSASAASRALALGRGFAFRVRARDSALNTSAWAEAAPFRVNSLPESSPAIAYSGRWTSLARDRAVGGRVRYSTSRGARAALTFGGRAVAVVAPLRPTFGSADICVDPGTSTASCRTVDLGPGSTWADRRVVFARSGLNPARSHRLRVIVHGGRVELDHVVALR